MFWKKKKKTKVIDWIWVDRLNAFKGLLAELKKVDKVLLISFFRDSLNDHLKFAEASPYQHELLSDLSQFKGSSAKIGIILADDVLKSNANSVGNRKVIFTEHYPLAYKDKELIVHIEQMNESSEEVVFVNALDDPFFAQFGSERIVGLMKTMGMKDDEMISHNMISKSIENAQKKLASKVTSEELQAHSLKEWFQLNVS